MVIRIAQCERLGRPVTTREIRRVLEFMGLQVSRLIRVAYGPFELGELPVRGVVEIEGEAIARLKKSFGRGSAITPAAMPPVAR